MSAVPEFDLSASTTLLRHYTERRNYARDADRRSQAYQDEISRLVKSLREKTRSISDGLSDFYSILLDTSTTFGLFVQEKGEDQSIAQCYIDTSVPPIIALLFRGQGLEDRRRKVVLAPGLFMLYDYAWYTSEDQQLTTDLLGDYCLESLLTTATRAVINSTTEDPVLEVQKTQDV